MDFGVWVLVGAVATTLVFGSWRAARDGRFRGTRRVLDDVAPAADPASPAAPPEATPEAALLPRAELGERATLLQFSSAFCTPCRATRRVLGEVAGLVPGVRHVEVDAEEHLELVRRLGVLRTPTTLVLDQGGAEVSRAGGAPRKEAVLATLERVLGDPEVSHGG